MYAVQERWYLLDAADLCASLSEVTIVLIIICKYSICRRSHGILVYRIHSLRYGLGFAVVRLLLTSKN